MLPHPPGFNVLDIFLLDKGQVKEGDTLMARDEFFLLGFGWEDECIISRDQRNESQMDLVVLSVLFARLIVCADWRIC